MLNKYVNITYEVQNFVSVYLEMDYIKYFTEIMTVNELNPSKKWYKPLKIHILGKHLVRT